MPVLLLTTAGYILDKILQGNHLPDDICAQFFQMSPRKMQRTDAPSDEDEQHRKMREIRSFG